MPETIDRGELFKFFLPADIEKQVNPSGRWVIRGIASTSSKDFQGDVVPPENIDITLLKKNGWITYEHMFKEDKPETAKYIVGAPTDNTKVTHDGLYVEAVLRKDNEYARQYFELARSLAKSGIDRKLGFSIEGRAKRNKDYPEVLDKVYITNVAITTHPANPDARFDAVIKSLRNEAIFKDANTFTTGYGTTPETQTDAAALRPEDFAHAIHTLAYGRSQLKDVGKAVAFYNNVCKYMDDNKNTFNDEDAKLLLQVTKGYSRHQANSVLINYKEGVNRASRPV